MTAKPAIGFLTKDGQAPFTDKVISILEHLKNNPHYPAPTPDLTVVEAAFTTYKVAAADAVQGGTENTAIRDARPSPSGSPSAHVFGSKVWTPMLDFFEKNPHICAFGGGNFLFVYQSRTLAPPSQIQNWLNFLSFLHNLLKH